MAQRTKGNPSGRTEAEARIRARGLTVAHNNGNGFGWITSTRPYKDPESGIMFFVKDNTQNVRGKADARVGVRDEAVLDGKTCKKLRKS